MHSPKFVMTLLALAMSLATVPAFADGGVKVPLADVSGLSKGEARSLLEDLVYANVASANCEDYAISDAEFSLLTGSADLIAADLGLSTDDYDADYYTPAFAGLDDAEFCDLEGPGVAEALATLLNMGGSTEIIPDEAPVALGGDKTQDKG